MPPSPEQQLAKFIAKFTPELAPSAHEVLAKMRVLFPGALELVYDNYNALAIGFASTERLADVICSIAMFPRWISLFFFAGGPALPDPHKLLKGTGTKVRHIVLSDGAATLDRPAVRALIKAAQRVAPIALDPAATPQIIIKSISPKQRPRRPAPAAKPKRRR